MYGAHSETWKNAMVVLWSWVEVHGDVSTLALGVEVEEIAMSRWVNTRRHEHRTGHLDPDQITQLQALPGWSWGTGQQEKWATTFAMLCLYTAEHGTARVPGAHVLDGVHLGKWVSRQRTAQGRGHLPTDRAQALQRLPGWEWTPGR